MHIDRSGIYVRPGGRTAIRPRLCPRPRAFVRRAKSTGSMRRAWRPRRGPRRHSPTRSRASPAVYSSAAGGGHSVPVPDPPAGGPGRLEWTAGGRKDGCAPRGARGRFVAVSTRVAAPSSDRGSWHDAYGDVHAAYRSTYRRARRVLCRLLLAQ